MVRYIFTRCPRHHQHCLSPISVTQRLFRGSGRVLKKNITNFLIFPSSFFEVALPFPVWLCAPLLLLYSIRFLFTQQLTRVTTSTLGLEMEMTVPARSLKALDVAVR